MRIPREALVLVYRERGGERELLVLRRAPAREGYWHAVAGAPEGDETDAEAAVRELREETGLDAGGGLIELGHRYVYPLEAEPPARRARYAPGVEAVSGQCFAVEAPAGWEPRLDDEHDAYRWCPAHEAVRLLRWPEAREAVRVLERRLEAAA